MSLSLQFIIINVRGQDQPWTASIQYEYQYNSINIQYSLDGCSLGISSGFSFIVIHVITRSWLEYDEIVLHLNNGGPCTPIDHHIMRYNHNQFAAIFTAKTQFVVC